MSLKLDIILWYNDRKPRSRVLNLNQLQYLLIVGLYLLGERVRANVNHIDVRVFYTENPCHLRILSLLELFNRHSLHFANAEGIYVNFHPWLLLDGVPSKFELFLHFAPNFDRVYL